MDLLPTLAKLSGGQVPTDRVIDGHDLSGLLRGDAAASLPNQDFFYYQHIQLQAVRSARWKLVLPRSAATSTAPPAWAKMIAPEDRIDITEPMLFDLDADIGEQKDVAAFEARYRSSTVIRLHPSNRNRDGWLWPLKPADCTSVRGS